MGEAVKCLVETAVCEIACTVVWEVRVVRPVLPDLQTLCNIFCYAGQKV